MKYSLTILILAWAFNSHAAIFQVGATKTYNSPNHLYSADVVQDGDTIEIDAENYIGQLALAVWQKNDLLIKGVGGRPHLRANGAAIWGKGIWVLAGNNITVELLEFSEASVPDKNGAGIRLDGTGLTVRNCYFHHNENGILTANTFDGDILIEYSEFDNNGFGDGLSHNLYVGHVNKLTFRFNYSHHAIIGHNLKSRAEENYILYNRIMDEESGNSSRLIDLPNGGLSIVMGNLLMQGEDATNNNMLGYGLEGLSNTTAHDLYVVNNTFVNKRVYSCIFVAIENGTVIANVSNNIFAGTGTLLSGITTEMNNNLAEENIAYFKFNNEPEYDYQLASDSPAKDAGISIDPVNGFSLTPEFSYIHPTSFEIRSVFYSIDAGAYEVSPVVSNLNATNEKLLIYPNPTNGTLSVEVESNPIKVLTVFDALGRVVFTDLETIAIDMLMLESGLYYLKAELRNGNNLTKAVLKY